jgi:hypothetical protein
MLGHQSLSATIQFIPPPLKEQEDHAQNGELLQHACADGQHRRFGGVVVAEDRWSGKAWPRAIQNAVCF